eukprot:5656292-Amphidinium_carterae.1
MLIPELTGSYYLRALCAHVLPIVCEFYCQSVVFTPNVKSFHTDCCSRDALLAAEVELGLPHPS